MSHWIQISTINEEPGFPIRAATAYKRCTQKKYPQMFKALGGKVFIDRRVLEQILGVEAPAPKARRPR